MALTTGAAALVSFLPALAGRGNVPRGLILVLLMQVGGFLIARAYKQAGAKQAFVSCFMASAVMLPLLSLQVTLLREPYVSIEDSSAGPAMFATLVVAAALVMTAAWALSVSWRREGISSLLFLPAALLVPMMIGMRQAVYQRPALEALAEVMAICSVACLLTWIVPGPWRPMIPAIALGSEFVLLWVLGRGPWFHVTSGDIVKVLYSLLLALSVVLIVLVPFLAMWLRGQTPGWRGQTKTTYVARRPVSTATPDRSGTARPRRTSQQMPPR